MNTLKSLLILLDTLVLGGNISEALEKLSQLSQTQYLQAIMKTDAEIDLNTDAMFECYLAFEKELFALENPDGFL